MRFGVNVILDTLRGSKTKKVLRFGRFQPLLRNARQGYHRFSAAGAQLSRSDGLSGRYRRSVSYCKSERKGTVFMQSPGIHARTHDEGSKEDYAADTCKAGAASARTNPAESVLPCNTGSDPSRLLQAAYRNRTGKHIPPILSFPTSHWNPCVSFCLRLNEMLAVHGVGELKYKNTANSFWRCARSSPESQRSFKLMFQQKINKDTILHYGSMLLGAVLSLACSHPQPEQNHRGGILGLTLFCITGRAFPGIFFPSAGHDLHHWLSAWAPTF